MLVLGVQHCESIFLYILKWSIIVEIKEEILKIPRKKWQWKHDDPKPMGCSKSSSKREVYSNMILPQEIRKISNKQPNLTPKAIRERRTKKPQS